MSECSVLPGSCRSCSRRGREFYYLGHVRSRHRYRPSAQRWAAAGGMIPPRVSYSAACNFFRNYDVRFGKQRVDTCETCTSFEFQLAGNLSPEMRDQVHADFQAHLRASDESFKFRHDDHERCCNLRPGDPDGPGEENPTFSCADIDFAGGAADPTRHGAVSVRNSSCKLFVGGTRVFSFTLLLLVHAHSYFYTQTVHARTWSAGTTRG